MRKDSTVVRKTTEIMEVIHTNLSKITKMVLVEEDSVVMHASDITATSEVLLVLANTTVPYTHVPSLTVLPEMGFVFASRN